LFTAGAVAFAAGLGALAWAANAMVGIERAEADRDRWQRPADVLDALDVPEPGTVGDLGSGVGYFTLRLARRVGPRGRVVAVDVRALPLLLLRLRALPGGGNVTTLHADVEGLDLEPASLDAVLIANTFHELGHPDQALGHAFAALRPNGRLVVVDPSREAAQGASGEHRHLTADEAALHLQRAGFEMVRHQERYIDVPGQLWRLLVARKPGQPPLGGHP
jgi:ubiquinone/menaquinone biosynthesis C-methylase UbiE